MICVLRRVPCKTQLPSTDWLYLKCSTILCSSSPLSTRHRGKQWWLEQQTASWRFSFFLLPRAWSNKWIWWHLLKKKKNSFSWFPYAHPADKSSVRTCFFPVPKEGPLGKTHCSSRPRYSLNLIFATSELVLLFSSRQILKKKKKKKMHFSPDLF